MSRGLSDSPFAPVRGTEGGGVSSAPIVVRWPSISAGRRATVHHNGWNELSASPTAT